MHCASPDAELEVGFVGCADDVLTTSAVRAAARPFSDLHRGRIGHGNRYFGFRAFKLLLDHIGLDPNVARDPRVKLPKQAREEPQPPSREHFEAIIEALGPKWKLLFVTIEQGALRIGEAVSLRWADVDAAGLRLRLPRSATKRVRARWVYLPEWLMQALEETCPLEDRVPERKVFQGTTEDGARSAMARACRDAKVPHYHPHDLRHRRATIWHQSGVSARDLAERMGHSKPSMSLDVYSHVMPPDEIDSERFLSLLGEVRPQPLRNHSHRILRIKRPDGGEERRVMFYERLPTPGSRLHLAGEPIEITSAGFFSTRFVVVAKPLS